MFALTRSFGSIQGREFAARSDTGCQALTKLIREPKVVSEEVGHVVVQPFQHVQGIIYKEDCVIISI